MIKVIITSNQDVIKSISIDGHADSGPHGQDLVCSAVSMVGISMLNALDIYAKDTFCYEINTGHIMVEINDITEANQWILKVIKVQLESCEENYKKFIRIKKMEV